MSQVKEIENSFMNENKIPQNYLVKNVVVVDQIEDFETPHKIYYMSDITVENFGRYLLDSPFKRHTLMGQQSIESFRRRLNNEIFENHYE